MHRGGEKEGLFWLFLEGRKKEVWKNSCILAKKSDRERKVETILRLQLQDIIN